MRGLGDCSETLNKPKHTLKEARAKAELSIENPERRSFELVRVDGCVFGPKDPEDRCDFLVRIHSLKSDHFIELKGSNVVKAIAQLSASLCHATLSESVHKVTCWAILTKRAPATRTRVQVAKARFKKRKMTLRVENSPATLVI